MRACVRVRVCVYACAQICCDSNVSGSLVPVRLALSWAGKKSRVNKDLSSSLFLSLSPLPRSVASAWSNFEDRERAVQIVLYVWTVISRHVVFTPSVPRRCCFSGPWRWSWSFDNVTTRRLRKRSCFPCCEIFFSVFISEGYEEIYPDKYVHWIINRIFE